MERLEITDANYEGYAELFNRREEISKKTKVKNIKIYAGIFTLSMGVGVVTSLYTDCNIGSSIALLVGGWLSVIQGSRNSSFDIDDLTFSEIQKKYPNIDLMINQELLFLALSKEGMIVENKNNSIYAKKENFKSNDKKVLCKK